MTRQIDIADALEAYDADAHRKGETLPLKGAKIV